MNPVFIYQNEATLDHNNKFTINFIDNEIVNFIKFYSKNQYYISSLNCNITKANKKNILVSGNKSLISSLSSQSRELIDKGPLLKNDIDYITATLTDNFDLKDIAPQKYNIVLDANVINENSYRYQFYDESDERLKFARIYSPFLHLKNGMCFQGENDSVKNNFVIFKLVDNYRKIECVFIQSPDEKAKITNRLYRDVNAKFVRHTRRNGTHRWWGINPALTLSAQEYKNEIKTEFHTVSFMKTLYFDLNYQSKINGKYKVIGTAVNRVFNGATIPIIQNSSNIELKRNESFFVPGMPKKQANNFKSSILNNCTFLGTYVLTNQDKTAINEIYPNFSFNYLNEYTYRGNSSRRYQWGEDDLSAFPSTKDNKANFKKTFLKFVCSKAKYSNYLNSGDGIFFYNSTKDLPDTLIECEKVFDEEVLKIKKLVADIGQISETTENEHLNLTFYDDSNLIEETFVQRFNKQLQLYGFISIPFLNTKKNHLISLKNLLPFRVKRDIQKENLTFELAYLEKEEQIATDDKKIYNFSIVCVEKKSMGFIEKESTIEGIQSFDQYKKLNPIEIKITDPEIYKRLIFKENRRIKYRFIPNNILISSSVQEETEIIFLIVNGLNDARDIMLNGTIYKAIGCIFTNEIESWDKIKKTTSNWVNCKFSNSKYPFGAKHLSFEFDTTSFHNLLDFNLYLLDQNGKEITFLTSEQKVPTLNFTIQIIS